MDFIYVSLSRGSFISMDDENGSPDGQATPGQAKSGQVRPGRWKYNRRKPFPCRAPSQPEPVDAILIASATVASPAVAFRYQAYRKTRHSGCCHYVCICTPYVQAQSRKSRRYVLLGEAPVARGGTGRGFNILCRCEALESVETGLIPCCYSKKP